MSDTPQEPKELTTEQALVNLDIFTSRIQGTRDEHATVQESIRVLARTLGIPINGEKK